MNTKCDNICSKNIINTRDIPHIPTGPHAADWRCILGMEVARETWKKTYSSVHNANSARQAFYRFSARERLAGADWAIRTQLDTFDQNGPTMYVTKVLIG